MNSDDPSKNRERRLPPQLRWMAIALAMLSLAALLYSFSARNEPAQTSPAAPLAQIVRAISAGEVKTLTVRGDVLTATKTDDSKITARKESNLSALETLTLLGAPAEALTNLPLVVEDPSAGVDPTGILFILSGLTWKIWPTKPPFWRPAAIWILSGGWNFRRRWNGLLPGRKS